ncbi:MAG TPA: hypothetical protein VFW39_10335 [Sphingomicrobium sp.]|nr:hypothetical protein [Sphingomicrobium sp.]
MDVNDTVKPHDSGAAPEPYSAEWWQERSATELRDIIKHGFRLGAAYDGAVAETERRAREATRRMRDQALDDRRRKARNRLITLALALVAFAVSGTWLLWAR